MKSLHLNILKLMDSIINKIAANIHDFSVSDQAFTRCRKLNPTDLIKLILNMGAGSLNSKIFHAFPDVNSRMTASAFEQQKAKLKPECFKEIMLKLSRANDALQLLDNKYLVVAIDGSDFDQPFNPKSENIFQGKDGRRYCQVQVNALYDVLNKLYLDLIFQPRQKMDQGGGWNALFWNNHDQPWALNRFGNTGKYREKSAEMLATATHLMRGTPYIYMGEEIGMMDPDYSSMNDYVDVEAKNAFKELTAKGRSEKDAFEIIKTKARDNSRVPMHWDDSQYAGFSDVKPWLMPTDQNQVNVEKELASGEIFDYYQKLIKLRKNEKLISDGHIKMFLKDHPQVFAYERFLDNSDKKLLVFTNFYGKECQAKLPKEYVNKNYQVLISNYEHNSNQFKQEIILKPYEALAVVI